MNESIVIMDTCGYFRKDNGTCVITGWLYFADEEEEPYVQVRADHLPMECTMIRVRRPDVLEARTDLDFKTEKVGYEIHIPNMETIFQISECLRVRICCGDESYPILQKSLKEVQKEYYKDTIKYFIERLESRIDKVHIEGWCINTFGELKMEIVDEKGNAQSSVHWISIRRTDLREQFGVSLDQCHGFLIDIPRDKIAAKELHLRFSNPATEKDEVVNMAKFDRENTRLGRVLRVMGKENLQTNKEIIKKQGIRAFVNYVKENSLPFTDYYGYYEKKHASTPKELKAQAAEIFSPSPKFSIVVPLYNTPLGFLKDLIDSVMAQSYGNWQLCLADGSDNTLVQEFILSNYGREERICYKLLEENKGISANTNGAIEMADGDYIVFADHDDVLSPDALYYMACTFRDHPDGDLAYSDEDLIDVDGNYIYPHFKPDFNVDYLRCINYICHLVAVKRSLVEMIGGLNPAYDGAQDYDFLLRVSEKTSHIYHIPRVLYHWRSHDGSTAGNQESKQYAIDAGERALEEHFKRMGIEAEVKFSGTFILYTTKYLIQGNPKVSILIPNKDHVEDLEKCVASIEEKSTWKNYEIIVIENNSEEEETFAYYEKLEQQYSNIRVVRYEGGFNYSAINNFGAAFAEGEYLLLLNNDTEVITPDWLEQMTGCCQREDTAIVGAKLYYPDMTIQHAGIVIGMGGFAGHILTGYGQNHTGYMGRLKAVQEISAVTGACLMVKKSVFEELHGLDEGFAVALNDVDFCLRARALDKKVVFLPDVELFHYESKSRGFETTPEKKARFQKEIERFQERHSRILEDGDPYYNPNLSLVKGDCSLRKANETVKGRKV
ncbi:MAG: glycosyltransferase family 2 protein [Eubacteriales bacterium]|nr:glycosyltransferase family 2 protein [Eubacteriales bacterium]